MSIIVPAAGPVSSLVLLVGEAPGYEESIQLEPFVGPSGREQDWYLSRHGLSSKQFRRTNVVQFYTPGNPDPSPDQITYWTPHLLSEIRRTQPRLIVAVGRFAARWFLGDAAELEDCHGMPHRGGEFDPDNADLRARSRGAIIIPIYHPAFGLYNPDAKSLIAWDYAQVAHYLSLVKSGRTDTITFRHDTYAGSEAYIDVTGHELSDLLASELSHGPISQIGLDTEGSIARPWSVQISTSPGTAYVLCASQPDLSIGISAIQSLVDSGCLVVTHDAGTPEGAMYDTQVCRTMGLELTDANTWNTMEAAYELRLESKGLKSLCWRWLGMRMDDYMSLIGDVGREKQIAYLTEVLDRQSQWSKPEPELIPENDGTTRTYRPWPVHRRAESILEDLVSGKVNRDGKPTDGLKRWMEIGKSLRREVESVLGPLPVGTLDDIDCNKAIHYAGMDADGTGRLVHPLTEQLCREGLLDLFQSRVKVLSIVECMQRVGMPASRSKFRALREHVQSVMVETQSHISTLYFGGRPFNPGSDEQVRVLMRRRGLSGEKRTKTGKVSTAKKSIEHLRYTDTAIADVFTWREHAKIKSTYVDPLLEIADDQPVDSTEPDMFTVRCKYKPVTVASLRLSSEDPSLLNQPIRTELGRRVRGCYMTTGNRVLAAWDFSGQEARVAAHICNSGAMIQLFRTCRYCGKTLTQRDITYGACNKSPSGRHKGGDIHAETAYRVFGIPASQQDTFKHRLPCKTGFFGTINGMEGLGLLDQFRMYIPPEADPDGYWRKLDNCTKLVNEIKRKAYPELHATAVRVERETQRTGVVRSLFGMPRYLPAAWSTDPKEKAEAGRQAFNHIIQSTAQSMTQNAMVWIHSYIRDMQREGLDVWECLQIHDELLFQMDMDLYEIVSPIVVEGMTEHCGIELKVPIEVDGHMAQTWGELK